MTPDSGESFAVWLTRIEGKLDLSSMRHDKTDARLDNHEQRLHRHSNEISTLQALEHQRKGAVGTIKALWAVAGGIVVAIVAAFLRHWGM